MRFHRGLGPPQRLLITAEDFRSTQVAWEHRTNWNRVGRADDVGGWGRLLSLVERSRLLLRSAAVGPRRLTRRVDRSVGPLVLAMIMQIDGTAIKISSLRPWATAVVAAAKGLGNGIVGRGRLAMLNTGVIGEIGRIIPRPSV